MLFVMPRWSRDGGVGAHVAVSAAALVRAGAKVTVLCARNEGGTPLQGVDILESPALFDASVAPEARAAGALDPCPSVIHLHQVEEPELLLWLGERAPVVVSAHGYTACTSGVHYFRPGQECMRAHGPGCIPRLPGCAHTTNPSRLPGSYRNASLGLGALRKCDLAISYSTAIDRHLEINGVEHRAVVPYFSTLRAAVGSGHESRRRVVFAGRVVAPKGVGVLIRAARQVEAEFVVCGDGWRLQEMRELATRLGVSDRVRFTGWLDPGSSRSRSPKPPWSRFPRSGRSRLAWGGSRLSKRADRSLRASRAAQATGSRTASTGSPSVRATRVSWRTRSTSCLAIPNASAPWARRDE